METWDLPHWFIYIRDKIVKSSTLICCYLDPFTLRTKLVIIKDVLKKNHVKVYYKEQATRKKETLISC